MNKNCFSLSIFIKLSSINKLWCYRLKISQSDDLLTSVNSVIIAFVKDTKHNVEIFWRESNWTKIVNKLPFRTHDACLQTNISFCVNTDLQSEIKVKTTDKEFLFVKNVLKVSESSWRRSLEKKQTERWLLQCERKPSFLGQFIFFNFSAILVGRNEVNIVKCFL